MSFINEDTKAVAVGPIELDVEMARRLGWSEEVIAGVHEAIALLSRGATSTMDIETGKKCEACFAREPEGKYIPCELCGRGKNLA